MKEDWDQDDLWDLLGKTRPVTVSPFFARNVLREIRRNPERPWISPLVLRWLGAGALAVLMAGFFLNLVGEGNSSPLTKTEGFSEVFDAAAGLDNVVALEEFSISTYTVGL
ncbi:MAG: hypothetical protein IAE94_16055 [Chthoniobacterales bacterium]|nr:hypothetical protein [Chthoniobacterales bacterium]